MLRNIYVKDYIMQKNLYQRYIDKPAEYMVDAGEVLTESESYASPAVIAANAPTGLVQVGDPIIARSASTPFCYVNISWTDPRNEYIISYLIEYSKSADFSNSIRRSTTANTAALECDTSSTYYIRVAAQYPNVLSSWTSALTVTTPADTTAPPDVTDLAASFSNGDLNISWTEPSSETFKDARVRIYNVGKSVLYATFYSSTGFQRWAAAANLAATSGAGVTSVVVQVTSRSWGNVFGGDVETGTITSTAPSTPANVVTSWDADTGTASADCTFSWDAQTLIKDYVLMIDGVTYVTTDNKFSYTHSLNKKQHATNTGDYALAYSIVARNNLLQISSAASGTATNAVPVNPTVDVAVFFSTMSVSISNTNPIEDLDKYVIRVYNTGTLISTLTTQNQENTVSVDESGLYSVDVTTYDVFGRNSETVTVSDLTVETLTITQLRADAEYIDSDNNTPSTLVVLKDGVLSSTGVTYAASADWHWIEFRRSLLDRYKTATVSLASSSAVQFILAYGPDTDSSLETLYYYGTIVDGKTLPSSTSSLPTAQASPALYSQLSSNRVDITALKEARLCRLYFKNATNSVTVYEFYARRLIQSDDIEAETIKAINIGAHVVTADQIAASTITATELAADSVTADKINVTSLSAINANMGSLTAGSIVIGTTNKLWLNDSSDGGLAIGGSTKASAPFRVSSTGACTATNITITGTIGGTLSFGITGVISAGGGNCLINSSGITIDPVGTTSTGAIKWSNSSYGGSIYMSDGPSQEALLNFITNKSPAGVTKGAFVWSIGGTQYMALRSIATAVDSIGLSVNTTLYCDGDINATNSRLLATINNATANNAADCLQLTRNTTGTAAAGLGINQRFAIEDAGGTVRSAGVIQCVLTDATAGAWKSQLGLYGYDSSAARLGIVIGGNGSATVIGFFGATPVVKPTALTATNASTVDSTYGAEEAAVINNTRTRVNELETKLQALGLLS